MRSRSAPSTRRPTRCQVGDAGRIHRRVLSGGAQERGLVHPDRGRRVQPCRVVDDRLAASGDDPHDRRPADTERGRDPRHGAVLGADRPGRTPTPEHGRSGTRGVRSQDAARSRSSWSTTHAGNTRLVCASTPRPVCRRSAGRAPTPDGDPSPAPPRRSRGTVPPARSSRPAAPAHHRHPRRPRNPSNPNNAATTEPVTSASTWGSSTIREILVVITDRASPRPTISSFQSQRRVAQVSPLPGSWRRARFDRLASNCEVNQCGTQPTDWVQYRASFGVFDRQELDARLPRGTTHRCWKANSFRPSRSRCRSEQRSVGALRQASRSTDSPCRRPAAD